MRIAMMALVFAAIAVPAQGQIQWRANLNEAYQEAQKTGKPILLHFYSDQCPACVSVRSRVLTEPTVQATVNNQFIPLQVDGAKQPAFLEAFEIKQYPTDVIVTKQGEILSHQLSPQSPQQFIAMLGRPWQTNERFAANTPAAPTQAPSQVPTQAPAVAANHRSTPVTGSYQMPPNLGTPAMTASTQLAGPANGQAASQDEAVQPDRFGFSAPPQGPVAGFAAEGPGIASGSEHGAPADSARVSIGDEPAASPMLDGFCPVTMVTEEQWVPGNPEFGAIHLGKTYLFASKQAQQEFLERPDRFAPVLNGLDIVRFVDGREMVEGTREFGYAVYNRVFLFSSEASMERFLNNYDRYAPVAIEIMEKAKSDSQR